MKCCNLSPGDLNRKVEFLTKSSVADGSGGFVSSLVPMTPPLIVWAKITPYNGTEKMIAQRLDAIGLSRVYVRYNSRITPLLTVLYQGEYYQIRSVIDLEEGQEWMELVIERGVAV